MSGAKIIEGLKDAVELAREGKTMREPPKRWRNWFKAEQDSMMICPVCGAHDLTFEGTVYSAHCSTWPSKDVAETVAAEDCGDPECARAEYLGAYPEGERP